MKSYAEILNEAKDNYLKRMIEHYGSEEEYLKRSKALSDALDRNLKEQSKIQDIFDTPPFIGIDGSTWQCPGCNTWYGPKSIGYCECEKVKK